MGRDENKLIRQLSLLSFLLSENRAFAAREIQESVEGYAEMSDETFTRRFHGDRADLARTGIVISAEGEDAAGPQLYSLAPEDYQLPGISFSDQELRALAMALAALESRCAYSRPLRLALTAISHGRHCSLHSELARSPVIMAPDDEGLKAGKQLARLEDAVTRHKTVSFDYLSAGDTAEQRTLDPYNLFFIQGRWYIVGLDHARNAIRTFRLSRIDGPVRFVTERPMDFVIPETYDAGLYRARPPWLLGAVRGTALVAVAPRLVWWVTRLEPHVQMLDEDEWGRAVFAARYAEEYPLLSWVVGMGTAAELVGPEELRNTLRQSLERVRSLHEGERQPDGQPEVPLSRGLESPEATSRAPVDRMRTSAPISPERLPRTLSLLSYLVNLTSNRVSWKAIERDLGLKRSEVEQDLSFINLANFGGGTYALMAEPDDYGVTVTPDLMADNFVRPARLSPLMARALLLALDLLGETIAWDGAGSLREVREKVCLLVGREARRDAIIVEDVLPNESGVLQAIESGAVDRRILEISYFNPVRDELRDRRVEPYLLFRSRDGWYLEAYCLEAEAQRTFKVERIKHVVVTDEHFHERPSVDLTDREMGEAFPPGRAENSAVVRFSSLLRSYLDDRNMTYIRLDDGTLRALIPYGDENWLASTVVRFLGEAVLEEPFSARSAVAQVAALEARRHGGSETEVTP